MIKTTYKYVCEHGVKGNHSFVHQVGPMTTADGSAPVPLCHPQRVEGAD